MIGIETLFNPHRAMLLKSADSKESQITILKNLLNHANVPGDRKQQIERELRSITAGAATEKQAAYEIDFYFGPSKNLMVVHDLRLEINGRVAQIDHLLMNRFLEIFVLETKTFSAGLSINAQGEFSTSYDGREVGIPSPIEQNNRHVTVLRDAFKQIGLPTRMGVTIPPSFIPVVLVSSKGVINRPKSSKIDLKSIIKSDQFFSWYQEKLDDTKITDVAGILKLCSANTIKELGEKLIALHRPGRIDYIKKFDIADSLLKKEVPAAEQSFPVQANSSPYVDARDHGKYYCSSCRKMIAEVVAKFCWNNKQRFGGKAYCRPCQNKF